MERLTTRNSVGVAVYKHQYECERCGEPLYRLPDTGSGSPTDKLAELEDLEEQRRLLRLPCSIGADVYMIPSKTNYLLNIFGHREKLNRIYHQNVERITFTKRGWYMECDKDAEYGTGKILVDTSYGVTWFLSHEEAEAKLKEMEESHD